MRGEVLTGQTFGRLTVGERIPKKVGQTAWHYKCHCICGRDTVVSQGNLVYGQIVSCGCYRAEQRSLDRVNVRPTIKKWFLHLKDVDKRPKPVIV